MAEELNKPEEGKVKRAPVEYRYDVLNWDFIKILAEIAYYAQTKYGYPEQYANARLESEKSPMNHIGEHYRQYCAREIHDKFGDLDHQLGAIAYNAMMEYYYLHNGGPTVTDKLYKPMYKPQTIVGFTKIAASTLPTYIEIEPGYDGEIVKTVQEPTLWERLKTLGANLQGTK